MTRFILVRHGQTEWNRVERFRGRADMPLNDTGRNQARRAGARLAREKIAAVYASPLARAMQTAEPIAEPHRLRVVAEAGLLDIDYGVWEGRTPDEVANENPKRYGQWLTQPERVKIPKGESLHDVRARTCGAVETLAKKHKSETIVLVSHKIVCKVLLCAILGLSDRAIWRIEQDTAAVNIFEKRQDGFVVVAVNDTSHLDRSV